MNVELLVSAHSPWRWLPAIPREPPQTQRYQWVSWRLCH